MKGKIVSNEEIQKLREESYSNLSDFEKRLFNNLELLISRVNRLKELEPGTLDYWTYYDIILTQIRAMFIESPNLKKNYTVQNYLNNIGQKKVAKEIDDYLDKELYDGISFREAVKVSVDKFIVHYDDISMEKVAIAQTCKEKLTQPDRDYNINNILKEFLLLLVRATAQAMVNNCPYNNINK